MATTPLVFNPPPVETAFVPPLRPPVDRPRIRNFFADGTARKPDERTMPASAGSWQYHIDRGWLLVDSPIILGGDRHADAATAGYGDKPAYTIGSGDFLVEVFDARSGVDVLILVVTGDKTQAIIAKGFPSCLEVLGRLKNVADAVNPPETPKQPAMPKPTGHAKKKK